MADDDFIEWLREGATVAAPPARHGAHHPSGGDAGAIDGTVEHPRRGTADDGEGEAAPRWRPDADRAVTAERHRRLRWVVGGGCAVLGIVAALAVGARLADGSDAVPTGGMRETDRTAMAGRTGAAGGDAVAPARSQPASAGDTSTSAVEGSRDTDPLTPAAGSTEDALDGRRRAAAAVAVRLALTAQGETARYVDLAVAEWVEDLGGGLAVVPVAVLLLEGRSGRWESVRPARYAVALRDGPAGPRAVGPPWPLPDASGEGAALPLAGDDATSAEAPSGAEPPAAVPVPVEPPERAVAVAAALEGAGYRDVALKGLVPGVPEEPLMQVHIQGIGPGEGTARTHEVWLHDGERLRVLGVEPVP